jgi:hypothetical protein
LLRESNPEWIVNFNEKVKDHEYPDWKCGKTWWRGLQRVSKDTVIERYGFGGQSGLKIHLRDAQFLCPDARLT